MSAAPPELAIVVACARPERVQALVGGIAERAAAEAPAADIELWIVGDLPAADIPQTGAPRLQLQLEPLAERHPNRRRNLALSRTRAQRIAFLDDDCLPEPGWLHSVLALDPAEPRVRTGPEWPVEKAGWAPAIHAASASRLAEGHRVRTNLQPEPVGWVGVSFCNVALSRAALEQTGPPDENVPWDMDDFEYFRRVLQQAKADNDPAMAVLHDRYPAHPGGWLRYKWAIRRRTGVKLLRQPGYYLRIPQVVAAAAAPWLGLALLATQPAAVAGLAGLWLATIGLTAARAALSVGRLRVALLLIGLHAVSLLAVQQGVLDALLGRDRTPGAPVPDR